MRTPVSSAPVLDPEKLPKRPVLADLNLQVVTPMFGGGVDPGVIDLDQIIRPSAIRGHLRFWWRACNAARFTSLKEMHKEERLLWGSATKKLPDDRKAEEATWGPGLIGIDVTQTGNGQTFKPTQQTQYATWPFQQDNPQNGKVDVTFRLRLTVGRHLGMPLLADQPEGDAYPEIEGCREAAAQALWAWITFGGVGARTRRGCGSLYCLGNASGSGQALLDADLFRPPADRNGLVDWLRDRIAGHELDGIKYVSDIANPHPIAMLTGCRIATGKEGRPLSAWEDVVEIYKSFVGSLDKNLRGELGLPRAKVSVADRMASPIATKALPTSATRAVPLVLLLNAPLAGISGGASVRNDFVESLSPRVGWEVMRP